MADLATLSIKVDASGAVTALDQLGAKLGQTEQKASTVTDALAKLGVAVSAGMIFKKFIDETSQSQFALAQLEARVKSTAGAAGQSVGQLSAMASEIQNLTVFSDEAAMGAEAMLLTFTKIKGDVFPGALKATADLATAMGTDLKSAALQLGKALQDPETGLTALRRSGVSFSEDQQKVIKALFDTGKEAEAQKLILAELAIETGGAAEAARNTLGGALAALKNAFGEVFEASSNGTSGLVQFIKAATEGLRYLKEHQSIVTAMAVAIGITLAMVAIPAAVTAFGLLTTAIKANTAAMLASPLLPWILAIGAVVTALTLLHKKLEDDVALTNRTNVQHGKLKLTMLEEEGIAKRAAAAKAALAKAAQDEAEAVAKLIKSKEDDAAATRREIDYAGKNFVAISALILQKEKLLKINAAIAAATVPIELPKFDIGDLGFPDPGKWITATIDAHEQARLLAVGASAFAKEMDDKDAQSRLATHNKLEAAKTAVTAEAEKQNAAIRENFVKQLQQTFATGIANMLENGLSSWRSFFDSIKSMFLKLVADMASARVMAALGVMGEGNKAGSGAMAGFAGAAVGYGVGGMTRNTSLGAVGGAASGAATGAMIAGPMGALVGGLAGLVGGFLGASNAAKKFAAEMVQQQNTLMAAAQAFVDRGLTGQAEIESKQNKLAKERDDLLKALEANFKAGGFGTGGAANYQRTVEEIGFAYDRQKKALEETTKAVEQQIVAQEAAAVAAEAFNASLTAMDLDARRLAATGFDEQSAATSLFTRQAREYAQAVRDGWSIEQLINLQEVQALEALSAVAKKASTDVIYSANSLAAMADQVVEVSAAWQKTIDGLSAARNAAEQTANAIRKTVDATRTLFDTLSGYMKSLLVGTLSPLTKSQQVAEARSQFEDAARKAAFGDLEAGGKVTGLANTFLQLMKDTSQASAQAAQDAAQAALPKYFRTAMPAIEGTQTAEYQQAFADVSAMIDAATLGVGGQLDIQVQQLRQAELQTGILGRMLAQANAAARGIPFFAHGGDHSGGMAIVGERGPELINTGRARIFSAADSAAAFAGNSTATVEELRRVIARLETLVRVTAAGAQETVKAVARVSIDVASLTREVRLSGEAAA